MKKKISLVLCCLLMLSMIMPFQNKKVLAAENKTNEFKSEVEGSTSNFVKFFIEDRNHEQTFDEREFIRLVYNYNDNSFDYPYNTNKKIESTETGWIITVDILNLTEIEKCYVSIVTSKYLFTKEITKADSESTIELKIDENYVPLEINVPFSGKDYNVENVSVSYVEGQNNIERQTYSANLRIGTLVPSGKYHVQLIGHDEDHAYNLTRRSVDIRKDNNTITFNREDVGDIKINLHNEEGIDAELLNIVPKSYYWIMHIQGVDLVKGDKKYNSVYLSKIPYYQLDFNIKVDNWQYRMHKKELYMNPDSIKDPMIIDIGTKIQAIINLNKESYEQGEELADECFIKKDAYDNIVDYGYTSSVNLGESPNLKWVWELKNDKGETIGIPMNNKNPIKLPNVVGTYDISIKETAGPLRIVSDPVKIILTPTSDTAVKFADANLEKVVREAINKPEGEIYKSDLTEVLILNSYNNNISSLEGIENLSNLLIINLINSNIEDITPLSSLDKLIALNLYRNKIKNIEALENMNNLQELILDVNQIEDISILKNKVNLRKLSVCANPVKELEVLRTLPNLTSFHFGENQNVDISTLECLPNLTDLRWAYTGSTENIGVLKNLTKLEKVRLSGNKIKDITPLANLTNISELYIDENQISDITPLVDNCINGGFIEGPKSINMSNNNLDITQGYKAYNDIQTLISKGINVICEPQNTQISQPSNKLEVELLTNIGTFKIGEDNKLEYRVTNNTSEEKEVTLIIGVYNEINKLVGDVEISKIVKVGEILKLESGNIKLPAGACKVKAFVWDSLNKMNPYIDAIEIPVN